MPTLDGIETLRNSIWENVPRSQAIANCTIYKPRNGDQLRNVIQVSEENNRKLKAVGSAWSFSAAAKTDGDVIDTSYLERVYSVVGRLSPNGNSLDYGDFNNLFNAPGRNKGLALVGGGIKVRKLIDYLMFFHHLSLPTMGGSDGQSLSGILSTAVHGSDFNVKPVADHVIGIHFIGPKGINFWIQRRNTREINLNFLNNEYKDSEECGGQLVVIEDDDLFNCAVVSLGRIGVIYAVALRLEFFYMLRYERRKFKWSDLRSTFHFRAQIFEKSGVKPNIQHFWRDGTVGNFDPNEVGYNLSLWPFGGNDKDAFFTWTKRRRANQAELNLLTASLRWSWRGGLQRDRDSLVLVPHPEASREELFFDFPLEIAQNLEVSSFAQQLVSMELSDEEVSEFLQNSSKDQLHLLQKIAINAVLKEGMADGDYRYISTGGTEEGEYIPFRPKFAEFACDGNDWRRIISFVNEIRSKAKEARYLGYISIRFTPETNATIGMQKWPLTCHVEVTGPYDHPNSDWFYNEIDKDAYENKFIPHWGMRNLTQENEMEDRYGDNLDDWRVGITTIYNIIGLGNGDPTKYTFASRFSKRNNLEPLRDTRSVVFADNKKSWLDVLKNPHTFDFLEKIPKEGPIERIREGIRNPGIRLKEIN